MESSSTLCFVLNFAPHYRKEIYLLIEKELKAQFYFGNDTLAKNILKMDYSLFTSPPRELKFFRIWKNLNWISGSAFLPFRTKYEKFVITGEPYCISSWILMITARIQRKKIFTWTHGMDGGETGVKKIIKRIYFKIPTGNFLYGNYAKDVMRKNGFQDSRLFVVFNSIHYDLTTKLRNEIAISNVEFPFHKSNLPIVIFIGRLRLPKKMSLLLKAQSILCEEFNFNFNLLIVGDGPDKKMLERQVAEFKTGELVKFYGSSYDESTNARLLFNADLCVSPGEVGLTAIHSLSYGTPVITHNNFLNQMPEFEAIIPGLNGDFFKDDDATDLANCIFNWFKKYPEKTNELRQNCFTRIDKYFNPYFQVKVFKSILN